MPVFGIPKMRNADNEIPVSKIRFCSVSEPLWTVKIPSCNDARKVIEWHGMMVHTCHTVS